MYYSVFSNNVPGDNFCFGNVEPGVLSIWIKIIVVGSSKPPTIKIDVGKIRNILIVIVSCYISSVPVGLNRFNYLPVLHRVVIKTGVIGSATSESLVRKPS